MSQLYSFFLNHYQWVILIAMIPYYNLIRRWVFLRYGTTTVIRSKKGTAVVHGVINQPAAIKKYGTDAVISGVSALVISVSSLIVPYFHSLTAAGIELAVICAMLALFLVSLIRLEKYRYDAMKMMRNLNIEKLLKMMEQQKDNSLKK